MLGLLFSSFAFAALAQYRVKLTTPFASLNANETGYFTGKVAQALADAGHTAVDALPTPAVHQLPASVKHQVRSAAAAEIPTSEADRQLLAAQGGVLASP